MIARLDRAIEGGHFFEASWYVYAILEDRLISLWQSSEPGSARSRAPRMMGPKIDGLSARAAQDPLLRKNFESIRLIAWKDNRNDLMHAMAEGTLSISVIDNRIEALARYGAELVREYSAAARRQKKHSEKTR